MLIYLRAETYPNEFRSPLVNDDINILKMHSNIIYVEKSQTRCIADDDWVKAGAELTDKKWHEMPPGTIVVGLKELTDLDKLNKHIYLYCFFILNNIEKMIGSKLSKNCKNFNFC